MPTITSMTQFKAIYLPETLKQEIIDKMTPEEYAEYNAQKIIDSIKPELENIFKDF